MLSLVKIRAQYLKRHMCGVYCSYLLIPSMIIFYLLIAIVNQYYSKNEYENEEPNEGKELESNIDLFQLDDTYQRNSYYDDITFLVEDNQDCNILKDLISSSFDCTDNEADAAKKNLIKIINKNGKYDIQFFQDEDSYFFYRDVFDSERMIDPFNCRYDDDRRRKKIFIFTINFSTIFDKKKWESPK